MSAAVEAWVRRLDAEVDGIEGLITVQAIGGRLTALVEQRRLVPRVMERLLALGVPRELLDLRCATEAAIPYPSDDRRIAAWLERTD